VHASFRVEVVEVQKGQMIKCLHSMAGDVKAGVEAEICRRA